MSTVLSGVGVGEVGGVGEGEAGSSGRCNTPVEATLDAMAEQIRDLQKCVMEVMTFLKKKKGVYGRGRQGRPNRKSKNDRNTKWSPLNMESFNQSEQRSIQQCSVFDQYHMMKVLGDKRKLKPFSLERETTSKLGGKPIDISTAGRNCFLIKVLSAKQASQLITIKSICGIQCEVSRHGSMNETRGILYVHEFDIKDGDIIRDGLASYGVKKDGAGLVDET